MHLESWPCGCVVPRNSCEQPHCLRQNTTTEGGGKRQLPAICFRLHGTTDGNSQARFWIMQGWGGQDSEAKADALIRDVLQWFYDNKGDGCAGLLCAVAQLPHALSAACESRCDASLCQRADAAAMSAAQPPACPDVASACTWRPHLKFSSALACNV